MLWWNLGNSCIDKNNFIVLVLSFNLKINSEELQKVLMSILQYNRLTPIRQATDTPLPFRSDKSSSVIFESALVVIHRFVEVARHSGLSEFHSCTLCREVSWTASFSQKSDFCSLYLAWCPFIHFPRFMTISEDRNKKWYGVWKLPFCHHRKISWKISGRTAFALPICVSISLLLRPTHVNTTARYLNFTCCSALTPTCSTHCLKVCGETIPRSL